MLYIPYNPLTVEAFDRHLHYLPHIGAVRSGPWMPRLARRPAAERLRTCVETTGEGEGETEGEGEGEGVGE